jgi:SAM-dependent methyltransferase
MPRGVVPILMSLQIARTLRAAYQRNLSMETRARVSRLRQQLWEIPIRFADLPFDVLDRGLPRERRLPPARLRRLFGVGSSRHLFIRHGERAAEEVRRALAPHGHPKQPSERWLDLGCGSGRVARHLIASLEIDVTGIDVDRSAVEWCARHLRGTYLAIRDHPPTVLPDGSFDVAMAVAVFSHFDEPLQFAWLAELRRLVRPGGLFLASTHSETLTYGRPELSASEYAALRSHGFAFRKGAGPFNEDLAFHTSQYLRREWSKYFTLIDLVPAGLLGRLDFSVWRV